jgi:hypothetical protein
VRNLFFFHIPKGEALWRSPPYLFGNSATSTKKKEEVHDEGGKNDRLKISAEEEK